MKKTPLYDRHRALGARIIDFGGWAMPVQYTTVIEEHLQTRRNASLFDVCHMGEIEVRGSGAFAFLQALLSRDITDQRPGQMRLTLLTNEGGGIIDDLTVYMFAPDRYVLVTNAVTKDKDLVWLNQMREKMSFSAVTIEDVSDATGKLDIQGPRAEEILQLLIPVYLHPLKYYHFLTTSLVGTPAVVSRSGYTGEDGFEIYMASERIGELWDRLLTVGIDYGIKPAGLGARDTLRLEAGLMLYGNEMDETVTPYEVVYGWVTNLEKDFVGRDALNEQFQKGVQRKLVGFEVWGRGIARHGYRVFRDNEEIGVVTSGTYAPTLGKAIGMALVRAAFSEPGTTMEIEIRGQRCRAQVVPLPFYRRKRQYSFFNLFI